MAGEDPLSFIPLNRGANDLSGGSRVSMGQELVDQGDTDSK